ncbi:LGFP repeat-containing protein [Streptomyces sp. NPDC017095]|uniref:LGFP repeat-containing protein n=1 Tax=Streptomyces sp. NPDC017095 TaxID=3364977 RepID=UPI0037A57FBE
MIRARASQLLALTASSALLLLGVQATPASAQIFCDEGHSVDGAIWTEYTQTPGVQESLGCPKSDEIPVPKDGGARQVFEHGSIYWSPNSGAHAIWGLIGDKWGQLGWEAGSLGYPTSDEIRLPDGKGVRQVFQGGSVYWSPDTGAHPVWGRIGERWGMAQWESGRYGYPISDEVQVPGVKGVSQMFEHGPIAWSPEETSNPQYAQARDLYLTPSSSKRDGGLQEAAHLLPLGGDRGIVVVRGYIATDNNPVNDIIGNHRQWSTDPAAESKVTVAWDTETGRVGVYVEHSCVHDPSSTLNGCRDAKPLVRTSHAEAVQDDPVPQNEYWVEPTTGGGIKVSISAVNSFVGVPGYQFGDLGRINATWYLTPHGYDDKNKSFTGFDITTTKDQFPSWEVLRYPSRLDNAGAPQAKWQGSVWQTHVRDLKSPQHTCTRNDPDSQDATMACTG